MDPSAGEVYWLELGGRGHEQRGRRPFIIVQDDAARALSTRIAVPTSTSAPLAPWRVGIELNGQSTVALVEQLSVVSAERFRAQDRIGVVGLAELLEIRSKAWRLLGFQS